jgi:hypothetical protein
MCIEYKIQLNKGKKRIKINLSKLEYQYKCGYKHYDFRFFKVHKITNRSAGVISLFVRLY